MVMMVSMVTLIILMKYQMTLMLLPTWVLMMNRWLHIVEVLASWNQNQLLLRNSWKMLEWSVKSFDILIKLLKTIFPNALLPNSFNETQSLEWGLRFRYIKYMFAEMIAHYIGRKMQTSKNVQIVRPLGSFLPCVSED